LAATVATLEDRLANVRATPVTGWPWGSVTVVVGVNVDLTSSTFTFSVADPYVTMYAAATVSVTLTLAGEFEAPGATTCTVARYVPTSNAVDRAPMVSDAGALGESSDALIQPDGPAASYTTLTVMPVSGALLPFVTRTRVVAAGFDPFCAFSVTAVLSRAMTGVGGGAIVNVPDVREVRPGLENVSVRSPAVPETESPTNVATPPTAATVLVPTSVPPPDAIDAVTEAVDVVTRLPAASRISITGWVASGVPTGAPTGCVRTANCVAGPGFTVT
jgi:hypothetical protein